jgi:MftR C-terminal domain
VFSNMDQQQWDRMRQQAELSMTTPEVRARAMDDFARTITVMAEVVARRTGLSQDDLRVRTAAGAIFGAILAATAPWDGYRDDFVSTSLFDRVDEALAVLEEGLSL